MAKQQIGFWVSLLALPFLALVLISSFPKREGLLEQLSLLKRETSRIQQENELLRQTVQSAQSEVLKELEVRKKLNYAKPGEVLVLFISPSPTAVPTPAIPWWQKIFR
jgi:cell division protein FtsB